jgi:hypothetical protein
MPEVHWPNTQANDRCAIFKDTLGQELGASWPAWQARLGLELEGEASVEGW